MLSIHGHKWYQEVHAPSAWVCPLCTDEEVAFSQSHDFTAHLREIHKGIFTEPQIEAITKQSWFQVSRPRGVCPLCCLPIGRQQNRQSKEAEHEHSASSSTPSPELIGSHIAAHLQSILLLTLRLISIDVAVDVSNDNESTANGTENWSSWTGSGMAGFGDNMNELEMPQNDDNSDDKINDEMSTGSDQTVLDIVPDTEYIDWDYVFDRQSSTRVLQDYQLQLWLIEQENKRRKEMTRLEQDTTTYPDGHSDLPPRTSIQGSNTDMLPNQGEQIIRGTSKIPQYGPPNSQSHQKSLDFQPSLDRNTISDQDSLALDHTEDIIFPDWMSIGTEGAPQISLEMEDAGISSSQNDIPAINRSPESSAASGEDIAYLERRQSLIAEFIQSEELFAKDMTIIQDIYQGTAFSWYGINPADESILFGKYKKVLKFSLTFLEALRKSDNDDFRNPRLSAFEEDQKTVIGRTFMEHILEMETAFESYIKRFHASKKKLESLQTYRTVNIWLQMCAERTLDTTHGLYRLLERPMKRLHDYTSFLSEIEKCTPEQHPDAPYIREASASLYLIRERLENMRLRIYKVSQILGSVEKEPGFRTGVSRINSRRTDQSRAELYQNTSDLTEFLGYRCDRIQVLQRALEKYCREIDAMLEAFKKLLCSFNPPRGTPLSGESLTRRTKGDIGKFIDEKIIRSILGSHVSVIIVHPISHLPNN